MTARLSARLEAVLAQVGRCGLLVDLCADHARLSLAAVERGQARRAVAIELRQAPLAQARRHVRAAHLEPRVLLVRGDGLGLVRAADAVVIAGVGGDLAAQLLERSPDAAGAVRVIVQPNRHSREVRLWARAAGFHLEREQAIADGRRLHLVLTLARASGLDPAYGAHPLEAELELGPLLLQSREPAARAHLSRELRRLREVAPRQAELGPALDALERTFHPTH